MLKSLSAIWIYHHRSNLILRRRKHLSWLLVILNNLTHLEHLFILKSSLTSTKKPTSPVITRVFVDCYKICLLSFIIFKNIDSNALISHTSQYQYVGIT
jgi:hypothetical protein